MHTHTHAQDGLPPRERDGRGRRGPPLDRSVALLDWVGVGVCACMLVRACVRLWASVGEGVKLGGGVVFIRDRCELVYLGMCYAYRGKE